MDEICVTLGHEFTTRLILKLMDSVILSWQGRDICDSGYGQTLHRLIRTDDSTVVMGLRFSLSYPGDCGHLPPQSWWSCPKSHRSQPRPQGPGRRCPPCCYSHSHSWSRSCQKELLDTDETLSACQQRGSDRKGILDVSFHSPKCIILAGDYYYNYKIHIG